MTTREHADPVPYRAVVAARLRRLEPPARLPGIDLARGLAVLGMFAAHLIVTDSLRWGTPASWTGLVDGRSSILFAMLAGVSLGLVPHDHRHHHDQNDDDEDASQRARSLQTRRRRLAARAAIIWALGICLIMLGVPVNVILPAYGVLFAIGIVFIGLTTRSLIAIAVVLATMMPFVVGAINGATGGAETDSTSLIAIALAWEYPFPLWAAFLAVGIVAGRFLAVPSRRVAAGLVGIGVALAALGYAALGPIGDRAASVDGDDATADVGLWLLSQLQDEPHSSGMGEAIGSGGFALAVLGVCTVVGSTRVRWVFWPVQVLGSMPLTAYTAHIVIWAVWIQIKATEGGSFDRLDDFRALEPFWPMTLAVTAGCVLWAIFVGRGPLEMAVAGLSTRLTGPARVTSTDHA